MLGSHLPAVLAAFQRRYPGVLLTLKEDFAEDVYADLAAGQIDFGIGSRLDGFGDISFRTLVKSPFVVVASKRLALNSTISLRDAMKHPQIALPAETNTRRTLEDLFRQHGATYSPQWEAKQLQTLFALVQAGFGVSIIPSLPVPKGSGRPYRIARLAQPAVAQEICLVIARGKRLSPPAAACCDLIVQELQKNAQLVQ